MESLKFREIVERSHLNVWTAQYALKHQEHVPDMPMAGSQGVHRVFSMDQAFRFALSTLLVQTGIPLRDTAEVIEYCEHRERQMRPARPRTEMRFTGFGRLEHWVLRIADSAYAQLAANPKSVTGDWYSISKKAPVSDIASPIIVSEIRLSRLVSQLTTHVPTSDESC